MNNSITSTTDASGWSYNIPSKEDCRIFMLNNTKLDERLWLLSHKPSSMKEAAMFTQLFNMILKNHPDELNDILTVLSKVSGKPFQMNFPPTGENKTMPGMISAIAQLIQYQTGYEEKEVSTMLIPKNKADWSVEIFHPDTSCIFSVNTAEPLQSDGKSLPMKVWLAGDYPEVLDGFCALLSSCMAKRDLTRMSVILKALIATTDATDKMRFFSPLTATKVELPSMGAYISHLILHRYMANFYLDMNGNILPEHNVVALHGRTTNKQP